MRYAIRDSNPEPAEKRNATCWVVAELNERYGLDLNDADRVWFEQQKTVVERDQDLKTVALYNDRSHYELVLKKKIDDLIVDRHEANGVLFDAYFENPQFRTRLLAYLSDTYEEFRAGA